MYPNPAVLACAVNREQQRHRPEDPTTLDSVTVHGRQSVSAGVDMKEAFFPLQINLLP